jgi:SAM-dependent methyltransferase
MKQYWNSRYLKEQKIWGNQPSKSAYYALKLFKHNDVKKIFIPGIGYGRNSKLFSNDDFQVVGVDISQTALTISKNFDPKSEFILGSILNMPFYKNLYDAVYCFNTLHLFLRSSRIEIIRYCYEILKKGGYIFFVVFSDKESSFGKGREIEENTFESKPGRPVHYFSERDIIEDQEIHSKAGLHIHILRYIFAQKKE